MSPTQCDDRSWPLASLRLSSELVRHSRRRHITQSTQKGAHCRLERAGSFQLGSELAGQMRALSWICSQHKFPQSPVNERDFVSTGRFDDVRTSHRRESGAVRSAVGRPDHHKHEDPAACPDRAGPSPGAANEASDLSPRFCLDSTRRDVNCEFR